MMMRLQNISKNLSVQILTILFFTSLGYSQQRAQFTQYLMNNYVLNPAAGGVNNYWDVKAGGRMQWTGLEGAPNTFWVSANGAIGYPHDRVRNSELKPHHGIGGYAFHDNTGPITMNGVYGSYAYHLKLTSDITASFGAFVGGVQYVLNGSDLVFVQNPNDPAIDGQKLTKFLPDATVGTWIYSSKFFVGASMNQLFENKLKIGNVDLLQGKLNHHYFITGGYNIKLNPDFDLIPSAMLKYVMGAPIQFDINAKIKYKNFFWTGVSYRHQDAVAAFVRFLVNNNFEIGYAYDITLSKLRQSSYGTHEIIVGVHYPFSSKRIMCPNNFWD
jgi:type IX secretion system PorP/SprF family membrane protein